eukprot:gene5025-5267_t
MTDLGVRVENCCICLARLLGCSVLRLPYLMVGALLLFVGWLWGLTGCYNTLQTAQKQRVALALLGHQQVPQTIVDIYVQPLEYVMGEWQQPGRHLQLETCAAANDVTCSESDNGHSLGTDAASANGSGMCAAGSHPGVALGAVVSLAVNPAAPELWLAGCSCGSVGLFSSSRSRPVLMWQQLTGGSAVLSVRWLPGRPCVLLVLAAAGCLLLMDLVKDTRCPVAVDGSSWLYQLMPELCGPVGDEQAGVALLQQLTLA